MRNPYKGDVLWHIPKRKRPIAYSTKSTSDLIVLLSQEYRTIQDVQDNIHYNQEAKAVLQAYIEKGYGKQIASQWFK